MPPTSERRYISPTDAAELLDVNLRTVYHYVSTGQIPASRLSHKTIRIALADLHAFVEARRIIALSNADVA